MRLRCFIVAVPLALSVACGARSFHPHTPGIGPVLWRQPAATPSPEPRLVPRPPFRFVAEDRDGDSPKFDVTDAAGVQWRVKLGPEAQTEIAAARLLLALGYFAENMHYLAEAEISGLQLTRGREFVSRESTVRGARFEARPTTVARSGTWDWAENPFVGTAPLDGLKVLMVLINNYDARSDNNQVLILGQEAQYVVADLGASFGAYGGMGGRRSKSDLEAFRSSRFIDRVTDGRVHFAYRTRPERWAIPMFVLNPFYAAGELKKERDLNEVPVESARWIAARLSGISAGTIGAWFDEAGYEPQTANGFAAALQDRIAALRTL